VIYKYQVNDGKYLTKLTDMKKLLRLLGVYEYLVCENPDDMLHIELFGDQSGAIMYDEEKLFDFKTLKDAKKTLRSKIFDKMIELWGTKELKDRLPKGSLR